jgi:hypothetical protein
LERDIAMKTPSGRFWQGKHNSHWSKADIKSC